MFINKNTKAQATQYTISGQKKIAKLFKKYILNVVITINIFDNR